SFPASSITRAICSRSATSTRSALTSAPASLIRFIAAFASSPASLLPVSTSRLAPRSTSHSAVLNPSAPVPPVIRYAPSPLPLHLSFPLPPSLIPPSRATYRSPPRSAPSSPPSPPLNPPPTPSTPSPPPPPRSPTPPHLSGCSSPSTFPIPHTGACA